MSAFANPQPYTGNSRTGKYETFLQAFCSWQCRVSLGSAEGARKIIERCCGRRQYPMRCTILIYASVRRMRKDDRVSRDIYKSNGKMLQVLVMILVLQDGCVRTTRFQWVIKEADVHGGSCCLFPSLNTRLRTTPTPSKTPSRIPQAIADPRADRGPP